MTHAELGALGVDRQTFDALVARAETRLRGQPETVQSIETRDGAEVELTPRFETKTPYWVEPTISTEERIAERDLKEALNIDATPPQMFYKQEWRDIDRKDALLVTSTKDLTPDQHRAAIYERRVAAAREASERAEKDAHYDRLLANVKKAARAARSAEPEQTQQKL